MLKRTVAKYSRQKPHSQIDEYDLDCVVNDMIHLFDVEDDTDMICVYQIKTEEQKKFFRDKGIPVDAPDGYFYVECYEE